MVNHENRRVTPEEINSKCEGTIKLKAHYPSGKLPSSILESGLFKECVDKKNTTDLLSMLSKSYTKDKSYSSLINSIKMLGYEQCIWLFYAVQAIKYQKGGELPLWAEKIISWHTIKTAATQGYCLPSALRYFLNPKETTTYGSEKGYTNHVVFCLMNKVVPKSWEEQVPDSFPQ